MRIVSLLPSATEIICAIGLRDQLVGVTHECDYPPDVRDLPPVTKTLIPEDASSREIDTLVRERLQTQNALYTLDLPVLRELRPDLIVTQALCEVCAVAEDEVHAAAGELPGEPRVINLEPTCLEDVLACMRLVGEATDRVADAEATIAGLRSRIAAVEQRSESLAHRPRVVILEWIDPPFTSGHWSPELVGLAGGQEVIGQAGQRSRTMGWDEIRAADPEVLLIACCGFDVERTRADLPILEAAPGWRALRCVQAGQVFVTDGSAYFSRPGPRLVDSLEILAHALHPAVHPLPPGLPPADRVAAPGKRA
jgi:iron complex transport system substrate-binding protein